MTAVCLIGNSHLAALKRGWPEIKAAFPGVVLDFYGSAGVTLHLEVCGGKLVALDAKVQRRLAMTSAKSGEIEPVYDAYVVCGLSLKPMLAIKAYIAKFGELRTSGRVTAANIEDLAAAMGSALRGSLAVDVMSKLRRITDAPIFLIATPLAAYERNVGLWKKMKHQETRVAAALDKTCRKLALDFSATFVPQPAETIAANGLTTRPEFYLLPVYQVKDEKADHTHMNPAFGAIVLRDVLEKIQARRVQAQTV